MAGKKSTIGPTGETVANNVARLRESQNLTYAELSRRLAAAGQPIPELGLRNIEKLQRKVDVDELMALCAVLQCTPDYLFLNHDESGSPHAPTELTGFGKFTTIGAWVLLNDGDLVRSGKVTELRHTPDYEVSAQLRKRLEKDGIDGLELDNDGDR